jgi:hypothetical protein
MFCGGLFEMSRNYGVGTLGRLLVALGLFSATAFADTVFTVSLDFTSLVGTPGTAVTFSGTILNASGVELFLNGAGGDLSSPELTLDLTPFFTLTPLSLVDGDFYTGDIFAVAISGVALPGDYSGTFTIQGGEDSQTFDPVGSADFQVTVTDAGGVPEPSSVTLFGFACLVLAVPLYRLRSRKPQLADSGRVATAQDSTRT